MTVSQSDRLRPRQVASSPSPPLPVSVVEPAGAAEPPPEDAGESDHPTLDQPIFQFDAPTPAPNAADFESIPETEAQVQRKRRRRVFVGIGAALMLAGMGWIWRAKTTNTAPALTDTPRTDPSQAPAAVARGAASSAPGPAVGPSPAPNEAAPVSPRRTVAIVSGSTPATPPARENPNGAPRVRPSSPHGSGSVQLTHSVPAF